MDLRRSILAGYLLLALFVVGFLGWAALTPIAGAVLAAGALAPESGQRLIQHPEGGRILSVLVAEGASVAKGALLVRLDASAVESEMARLEGRLAETSAEAARLVAERDGLSHVIFPPDLLTPSSAPLRAAQERLFAERLASYRAGQDQIALRIDQIGQQISGLDAGLTATLRQAELLAKDQARQADLVARGLQTVGRLEEVEREIARLDGQAGSQRAARAEAKARIAEARQQAFGNAAARREGAASDLRMILAEQADLGERLAALRVRRAALDLRAPVAGRVLGLRSAATVLAPGEPALILVPTGEDLVIQAQISAADRDQVQPGQPVMLRFPGLDPRGMNDVAGRVADVAGDILPDPQGRPPRYNVRIEVPPVALAPWADRLAAGMPVEVMIETRPRTALTYLTEPLTGYFRLAFRES